MPTMASDPVATLPDTKVTIASDPVTTPPDATPTVTPNPTATPPDFQFTMASDPVKTDTNSTTIPDPAAILLPTTPVVAPDIVTTPPDQASFASLPREIRDKIYRLAIPHSCEITPYFRDEPMNCGDYQILSPQASSSTYANEARAMLVKRNRFRVYVGDLQVMLGKDSFNYVSVSWGNSMVVMLKGSFEVKPWLRHIVIDITVEDKMPKLAGRVGVLLECPALRMVEVNLYECFGVWERAIKPISGAFKTLAEKLGQGLIFQKAIEYNSFLESDRLMQNGLYTVIGGLETLEMVARDENLDSEDENLGV